MSTEPEKLKISSDEIGKIMKYLDKKMDLNNMMLVSKQFYEIGRQDRFWMNLNNTKCRFLLSFEEESFIIDTKEEMTARDQYLTWKKLNSRESTRMSKYWSSVRSLLTIEECILAIIGILQIWMMLVGETMLDLFIYPLYAICSIEFILLSIYCGPWSWLPVSGSYSWLISWYFRWACYLRSRGRVPDYKGEILSRTGLCQSWNMYWHAIISFGYFFGDSDHAPKTWITNFMLIIMSLHSRLPMIVGHLTHTLNDKKAKKLRPKKDPRKKDKNAIC